MESRRLGAEPTSLYLKIQGLVCCFLKHHGLVYALDIIRRQYFAALATVNSANILETTFGKEKSEIYTASKPIKSSQGKVPGGSQ